MRRNGFFWGIVLIILGILFMLDNLGIIQFDFWTIFWPMVLILIGINWLWNGFSHNSVKTEALVLPLKGVETAVINLEYGVGEITVNGRTAPDELLNGTFGSGVEYETEAKGEELAVTLRSPGSSWWPPTDERNWEIGLNRDLPLALTAKTGACEARFDLADLNLSYFQLKTGASESNITLPALAKHTDVEIKTGAAEVNITVPKGVAARIKTDASLAEVKVDTARFPRNGKGYMSLDYDTAVHRADISISVGVGSVKIT